jgi:hypothetical protein
VKDLSLGKLTFLEVVKDEEQKNFFLGCVAPFYFSEKNSVRRKKLKFEILSLLGIA